MTRNLVNKSVLTTLLARLCQFLKKNLQKSLTTPGIKVMGVSKEYKSNCQVQLLMEFLQLPAITILLQTVCYCTSHHLMQQQEEIIGIAILVVRSKGSFTVLVPKVEGK
jgi:hypothetical protein